MVYVEPSERVTSCVKVYGLRGRGMKVACRTCSLIIGLEGNAEDSQIRRLGIDVALVGRRAAANLVVILGSFSMVNRAFSSRSKGSLWNVPKPVALSGCLVRS